jgi:hypothetical protein
MTSARAELEAEATAALKYAPSPPKSTAPGKPLNPADYPHLTLVPCKPYGTVTLPSCKARWKAAQGKGVGGKHAIGSIDARSSACRFCVAGAQRNGKPPTKPRVITQHACECGEPVSRRGGSCPACLTLRYAAQGHGPPKATGREPPSHDRRVRLPCSDPNARPCAGCGAPTVTKWCSDACRKRTGKRDGSVGL